MNFALIFFDTLKIPILLFFFQIVGSFFYGNFLNKIAKQKILETILGFIVTIVIYAIIQTVGKTIFILFFFTLLAHYLIFKIKLNLTFIKDINKESLSAIAVFFIFHLLYLTIQLYRHDYFNPDFVYLGWGDYGFYSDIAELLNVSGIERIDNNFLPFNNEYIHYSPNPAPYHYFELWAHAFLLKVMKNTGVFVFIYLFTPFVSAIVASIFWVFSVNIIKEKQTFIYIGLIPLAFLLPLFIGKIPFLDGGWSGNIFTYPRNLMFYILFLLFIIFYKEKGFISGAFFLISIAFVNILYVPSIGGSLILLGMLEFFVFKQKKEGFFNIVLSLSVILSIYVFYFIIFKSNTGIEGNYSNLGSFWDWAQKGLRYFFRLQLIRELFFFFPLALFVIYFLYHKIIKSDYGVFKNKIVILIFLLEVISLFFASFFPHLEAGTFHSIVLNPLWACLSFIAIINILKTKLTFISRIIFFTIIIQAIYSGIFLTLNIQHQDFIGQNYSRSFLEELSNCEIQNKQGAFISNPEALKTSPFSAKSNLSWHTAIFDVVGNGYTQTSLSAFLCLDSIPFEEIKVQAQHVPIYIYANNKYSGIDTIPKEFIIKSFVTDYKIDYIICEENAKLPSYFVPYIKNSFTDKYSGIKVYIIDEK